MKTHAGGNVVVPPTTTTTQAPKHISLPDIPQDSDLLFEVLLFSYSAVALFCQNLHLYKTVWWLPQSHIKYAIGVHLIDFQLVTFTLILLSRRLWWSMLKLVVTSYVPFTFRAFCLKACRVVVVVVILTGMITCTYNIFKKYQTVKLLYLCYPLSFYFILYGLKISPFLDLVPTCPSVHEKEERSDKKGKGHNSSPIYGCIQHLCSFNADAVREEVEYLREDANQRIKHVLFNSLLNGYYAAFIPCCFIQPHLIYDANWCMSTLVVVYASCLTAYLCHCFPPSYTDILHQAALHLGRWHRVESNRTHFPYNNWQASNMWNRGALVKHGKELFRAEGTTNAAEPSNSKHARFYLLFSNPSVLVGLVLLLEVLTIVMQFVNLFQNQEWYKVISSCLLIFANNYILFKLGRNWLIMLKVYRLENKMQ